MNSKILISSIYFKSLFNSKYENLWYTNVFLDEFVFSSTFFLTLKDQERGGGGITIN